MLKFVFWILLGLNAVLFAYGQGYLGTVGGNEHEPARLKTQQAADKLKLLPASEARSGAAATPPAPTAAAAAPDLAGCTEVGTFGASEARRFEARLARLDLGERQSRRPVEAQDITSYLVYLPPAPSKEAADRKVAELRAQGVTNLFIINGDSPYKWGISLGLFRTEAGAQTLLAALGKQGVRGARIAPRGPMSTRYAYQFRGIDADTRTRIAGYADSFNAAQLTSCR
ncbi:MAG: SPOR domain-containing protein [Massilia sp.]